MPTPSCPAPSRLVRLLILCLVFGTLLVPGASPALAQGAKPAPEEMRWALHVTLARWLDPAETEAFSTPFMVMNLLPKGGHFAAWEQPQLFCQEIRASFKSLRS